MISAVGLPPVREVEHTITRQGRSLVRQRLVGLAVIAATLCLLAPDTASAFADASESRKSFESKTLGAPVSTLQGAWSEEHGGRTVFLKIGGGHIAGTMTWFKAEWVAPYSEVSRNPSFLSESQLYIANGTGEDIWISEMYRFRRRGGPWSPWVQVNKRIPSESSRTTGRFGQNLRLDERAQWQFQWRAEGRVRAGAVLAGEFRLKVE